MGPVDGGSSDAPGEPAPEPTLEATRPSAAAASSTVAPTGPLTIHPPQKRAANPSPQAPPAPAASRTAPPEPRPAAKVANPLELEIK